MSEVKNSVIRAKPENDPRRWRLAPEILKFKIIVA
jgi:hypothetical protein